MLFPFTCWIYVFDEDEIKRQDLLEMHWQTVSSFINHIRKHRCEVWQTTQPWRELRWISCRILHQWFEKKMQRWGNTNSLQLWWRVRESAQHRMWRFCGGYDPQHSDIPGLQVFVIQEPGKDNTEVAYITGRNQAWWSIGLHISWRKVPPSWQHWCPGTQNPDILNGFKHSALVCSGDGV